MAKNEGESGNAILDGGSSWLAQTSVAPTETNQAV